MSCLFFIVSVTVLANTIVNGATNLMTKIQGGMSITSARFQGTHPSREGVGVCVCGGGGHATRAGSARSRTR